MEESDGARVGKALLLGRLVGAKEGVNDALGTFDGRGLTDGMPVLVGIDDGAIERDGGIDGLLLGISDGALDGREVGVSEGDAEGILVGNPDGDREGEEDGDTEGHLEGDALGVLDGINVGAALMVGRPDCVGPIDMEGNMLGSRDGGCDGARLGTPVGVFEGCDEREGLPDGTSDGTRLSVGPTDGNKDGLADTDGAEEGKPEGACDEGVADGTNVGTCDAKRDSARLSEATLESPIVRIWESDGASLGDKDGAALRDGRPDGEDDETSDRDRTPPPASVGT